MKKFVLSRDESSPDSFTIPYNEKLNSAQLDAVMHQTGPALVAAGAGTGKTRTLTYRVARLIESGTDPSKILLLTFTRRAAFEMLQRAGEILDQRCRQVKGGTFHHFCSSVLRKYSNKIGYPENFTILDAADSRQVIQLLRSQTDFTKGGKRFPQKSTLYSIFSGSVNRQIEIPDLIESEYPQFAGWIDQIVQLNEQYHHYKTGHFVMDFDDLLINTRNLLRDNEGVRNEVSSKLLQILVDEYQDTNKLQDELVQLFASVHGNVMVVGDDAQSIYSFRGADHKNMIRFPESHPNAKVIKLEQNYRSTSAILDLANRVLSEAKNKLDKELYSDLGKGSLPGLVKAATVNDQSRFVAQMILQMREEGKELSDIAVLFRNGRDSFDLEVELNNKKIPFIKYGGQKFTEAAHVKDVLAHLRVFVNPKDLLSWNRVLMLMEGIGPKTASELFKIAQNSTDPLQPDLESITNERYREQLVALSTLFENMKGVKGSVSDMLELVVEYYRKFCKKQFDDYPKRMRDLETFVDISGRYATVNSMLEEIALDPIESTVIDSEASENDENPLTLSTIHSAKGLEWDAVFIIQCLDGIIPSGYSLDSDEQIEEELRLFYVAITRAKNHLFISFPALYQSYYGDYFSKPSRFLDDIPDSILEPWMLIEESQQQNQLGEGKNKLKEGD